MATYRRCFLLLGPMMTRSEMLRRLLLIQVVYSLQHQSRRNQLCSDARSFFRHARHTLWQSARGHPPSVRLADLLLKKAPPPQLA
eukprot:5241094-Prorocentrum_lima.AAC.1